MVEEIKQLKFFVENHIPLDVTDELRRQGVDLVRSIEAGFALEEKDVVLLEYAVQEKRIMVTCDDDFIHLDLEWHEQGKEHAGIVYFSMRNDDCKDTGKIVRSILHLQQQIIEGNATYEENFYNQITYTYHL